MDRSRFTRANYGVGGGGKITSLAEVAILLAQFPVSIAAVERGNKLCHRLIGLAVPRMIS